MVGLEGIRAGDTVRAMPQALDVDREAVRAHVLTHGVREAARAFGLSENTVSAWSARGKWLADAGKAVTVQPLPKSMQPVASGASKPSEAARNSMERLGDKTKLVQAKAVLKGSRTINRMPGESVVAAASSLKALVDAGAKLHGWGAGQASGAFLGLHVTVRPDAGRAIDVDAEVIPAPDSQG